MTLRVVRNPAFAVISCVFPSRIAGTILLGVTGALATEVLLFLELFVEVVPTSDFFVIAIVILPKAYF